MVGTLIKPQFLTNWINYPTILLTDSHFRELEIWDSLSSFVTLALEIQRDLWFRMQTCNRQLKRCSRHGRYANQASVSNELNKLSNNTTRWLSFSTVGNWRFIILVCNAHYILVCNAGSAEIQSQFLTNLWYLECIFDSWKLEIHYPRL